jgi:threonine synthase
VLSTASAYKFAASVMDALGEAYADDFDALERLHAITRVPIPKALEHIREKEVLHDHTVKKDDIMKFVQAYIERKEAKPCLP